MGSGDGFCFIMKGAGNREFQPGNLIYSFEDKLSLSGLFQRMDNFLNTGLEKYIENQRQDAKLEQEELETVNQALGKEFPQKEELVLARENHAAVIRELQRMQEDSSYVSEWKPRGRRQRSAINKQQSENKKCSHPSDSEFLFSGL